MPHSRNRREARNVAKLTGQSYQAVKDASKKDRIRRDGSLALSTNPNQVRLESRVYLHTQLVPLTRDAGRRSSREGPVPIHSVHPRPDGIHVRIAPENFPHFVRLLRAAPADQLTIKRDRGALLIGDPTDSTALVRVTSKPEKRVERIIDTALNAPAPQLWIREILLNPMLSPERTDRATAAAELASMLLRCVRFSQQPTVAQWAQHLRPGPNDDTVIWLDGPLPAELDGPIPPALAELVGPGQTFEAPAAASAFIAAEVDSPGPPHRPGKVTSMLYAVAATQAPAQAAPAKPMMTAIAEIRWDELRSENEEAWFGYLVRIYEPRLIAAVYRSVDCQLHDARDLVAETLAKAWAHRDRLPPNPGPWLFITARHHVYNRFRAQRRRPAADLDLNSLRSETPDISEMVVRRMQLSEAMQRLSSQDRQLLWMHFVDGVGHAEMAAWLGISTTAVRKRIERAAARLRRFLGEA